MESLEQLANDVEAMDKKQSHIYITLKHSSDHLCSAEQSFRSLI